MVAIGPQPNQVSVLLWNKKSFTFEPQTPVSFPVPVSSVVCADFNGDGRLDVLVSMIVGEAYRTEIRFGALNQLTASADAAFDSVEPVSIFDYNGDLRPDLMATSSTGLRTVWVNKGMEGNAIRFEMVQVSSWPAGTFDKPVSVGFVDVNGDCRPDLVFTDPVSNSIKLFLGTGSPSSPFEARNWSKDVAQLSVPQDAGRPSFLDVDGDGNVDVIFPVSNNKVHVAFNVQKRLCSVSPSPCREPKELCDADPDFYFGTPDDPSSYLILDISIGTMTQSSDFDFGNTIRFPITLRTGDVNLNGYPDLLVEVRDPSGNKFTSIWQNTPCSAENCPSEAVTHARHTFVLLTGSNAEVLQGISNAYAAAFFDLDEDGSNDMIVLSRDSSANKNSISILINYLETDAFFFKAIGLNGVCPEWCPGVRFPNPRPYGVNQHGVTVKFTVTDIDGRKHARLGAQLWGSQDLALQTPYSLVGLGRTNNYVEEFYIGFPITGTRNVGNFPSMIPNSQLIVFPYKKENPSRWVLELLVSPSESLPWVILSVLCTMAALGVVIGFLQYKERLEDAAEKKKSEHFYAF